MKTTPLTREMLPDLKEEQKLLVIENYKHRYEISQEFIGDIVIFRGFGGGTLLRCDTNGYGIIKFSFDELELVVEEQEEIKPSLTAEEVIKYMQHHFTCDKLIIIQPNIYCTCGLEETITKLKKKLI